MAADGPAPDGPVGIDDAHIVAVIDIQPIVGGADAPRRAGKDGADISRVVAVADDALAPARAHDAAHALGVGIQHIAGIGAVFHDDAVIGLADAAHHARHHAPPVDIAGAHGHVAHGGLPAARKVGGNAAHVPRAAQEAHQADGHAVGKTLGGIAQAADVTYRVALPVQDAVEAGVQYEAVPLDLLRVHGEFAADGGPVGAGPGPVGALHGSHIHVGSEIEGLIGKVQSGAVDRVAHVAAPGAHQ